MSEFALVQHAALLEQEKNRRQQVAAKLKRLRELEHNNPEFLRDSSLRDYLVSAGGLQAFLDHIRETKSRKVLDIGTGTGKALSQIATSRAGDGLSFIGTALTSPKTEKPTGIQLHLTAAESLRGIQPDSVGGVLSIGSIGFSNAPELVVANIDRTLVDGGAIKATFRKKGTYGKDWDKKYDKWGYSIHDPFTREWSKLGYDLAIAETEDDDILVAVKPGALKPIGAAELLQADIQTLPEQIELLAS